MMHDGSYVVRASMLVGRVRACVVTLNTYASKFTYELPAGWLGYHVLSATLRSLLVSLHHSEWLASSQINSHEGLTN